MACINSYLEESPQTTLDASTTNLTTLLTVRVW